MHAAMKSEDNRRSGWIVVGATFLTLGMVYGVWYSYSVFFVAFLREFQWSRSVIAGGYSAFVLIHGLFSPISGWLAGRIGPRRVILVGGCVFGLGLLLTAQIREWWHLYVAFGWVAGIGLSMVGWVPSVVLVRGWFPGRIGTAVGVASAGIGGGMAGLVPLAQFMIEWIGWRWAFRILAVLILGWVLPATMFLVRDPIALEGTGPRLGTRAPRSRLDKEAYWTLATAVRDLHYWGLAGVFFTGNIVTQMLLVHQVAYLVDHGVSPLVAALVGGLVGLASIAGKMGWGTLSDRAGRELAYTHPGLPVHRRQRRGPCPGRKAPDLLPTVPVRGVDRGGLRGDGAGYTGCRQRPVRWPGLFDDLWHLAYGAHRGWGLRCLARRSTFRSNGQLHGGTLGGPGECRTGPHPDVGRGATPSASPAGICQPPRRQERQGRHMPLG